MKLNGHMSTNNQGLQITVTTIFLKIRGKLLKERFL